MKTREEVTQHDCN